MTDWFARYGKVIPLILGVIILPVQQALGDDVFDTADKIRVGLAIVGAVVTYVAPNLTGGVAVVTKGLTSAAFAVLNGLTGWLVDGMTASDWWSLLIAAAVAAGVLVLPSQKHPTAPQPVPAAA